ncbi:hypothetical protein [uncultured Victivallis sp.]|uniref:hypothetical protein n=1 Tax=uncultured Victivallis sp. TaxID=354118 RepID=UPI0025E6A102|nr:hypothetical protein [uncultured Victivallis sp.]
MKVKLFGRGGAVYFFLSAAMVFGAESPNGTEDGTKKSRLVIFNNDGCDIRYFSEKNPYSVEKFLAYRNTPLRKSDVGVVSYCTISAGFGLFSHRSESGCSLLDSPSFGYTLRKMREENSDPLREVIRSAHAANQEVFWSMRMNDSRHDQVYRPDRSIRQYPEVELFPLLKKEHPQWLCGSWDRQPPYGIWSAVNYEQPEIRNLCISFIREVARNYEVDGIELDFGRDPVLFRSVCEGREPTPEAVNDLTGMMRTIRQETRLAGQRRNRPIRIAIRVPDSAGYCRRIGIDLERWLQEGFVDILIGGTKMHLEPWHVNARLAQKYGVKFYANTTDPWIPGDQHPLLTRNRSVLHFRGQIAAAFAEGVDGIYSYNEYWPGTINARYLSEVEDRDAMRSRNKLYFFTASYDTPGRFVKDGMKFALLPILTPANPLTIPGGRGVELPLYLGEEEEHGDFRLLLWSPGAAPETMRVRFNGSSLSDGTLWKGLLIYPVPASLLKSGQNSVLISTASHAAETVLMTGRELFVYGRNQGLWRRLFEGNAGPEAERIVAEGYRLSGALCNLAHPLNVDPDGKAELSFELTVLDSPVPDSVVLRVANGRFSETIRFRLDRVELKHARKSTPFDTRRTHRYKLMFEGKKLRLFADDALLLETVLSTPCDRDRSLLEKAAQKVDFLESGSLLIGSLSPGETGCSVWKNLVLRSSSGTLRDAALLALHDRLEPEVQIYCDPEPLSATVNREMKTVIHELNMQNNSFPTAPLSVGHPEAVSAGNGVLLFDNRRSGCWFDLPLESGKAHVIYETVATFRCLDDIASPQIQFVTSLPVPNHDSSRIWGWRFGKNTVSFLDGAPVALPPPDPDGFYRIRILVDGTRDCGELYINGADEPLIRISGYGIPAVPAKITFGDNSSAISGRCELKELRMNQYSLTSQNRR